MADALFPDRPVAAPRARLPRAALIVRLTAALLALFAFFVSLALLLAASLTIAGFGGFVFVGGLRMLPQIGDASGPYELLFGISIPFAGLAMLTLGGGGVAVLVAHLFAPAAEAEASLTLDLRTQPKLDQFLRRLAADVGAPAPSVVLLDANVNAGMLRRRHESSSGSGAAMTLLLGLGLINALDLAEFKAVIAHEYAHFGQSGSRLGHWTHRATYSLVRIVLVRDRFDRWLMIQRSKGQPLRSAFADLLITSVQRVRALLWRLLEWVLAAERSLGREMELDADAQAVREAGSDAVVSGLWKAERAQFAFRVTLELIERLARQGHFVRDLFAVHDRRIAEFADKLAGASDPMAVALCRPYQPGEALHFPAGPAVVADRFDSHPSAHERERAAKRPYVAHHGPGPAEDGWGSAWALFEDVERLREQLTLRTYEQLGFEPGAELLDPIRFEALIAAEYASQSWFGQHHGFYDDRFLMLGEFEPWLTALERGEVEHESIERDASCWRGQPLAEFMDRVLDVHRDLDRLVQLCSIPMPDRQWRVELPSGTRIDGRFAEAHRDARQREALEHKAAVERADPILFAWAWAHLDPSGRELLVERYRFTLRVQELMAELRPIANELDRRATIVDQQGYSRVAADSDALAEVVLRARRELAATLHRCEQLHAPPVPTLAGQTNLRALVGVALPSLEPQADPLDHAGVLAQAIAGTAARLSQVHDRMIGAILELHDRASSSQPGP
jgi:Zn-dependent protease with chaperone function